MPRPRPAGQQWTLPARTLAEALVTRLVDLVSRNEAASIRFSRRAISGLALADAALSLWLEGRAPAPPDLAEVLHALPAFVLGGYSVAFWLLLVTARGRLCPAHAGRTLLACLVLGTGALALGFRAPAALAINLFWWPVSALTLAGVAAALGSARHTVVVAEALLAVALLHAFWRPEGRLHIRQSEGNGISWAFSFERPDQRIVKVFPRSPYWQSAQDVTYLRVDLFRPYRGPAGFAVVVDGVPLGVLNGRVPFEGSDEQQWGMPIPPDAVATSPLVTVELRPEGIDPKLAVAGHGDPWVEPLGRDATWLFDGRQWTRDHLAGPHAAPAAGTYRLWLITFLRTPER